MGYGDGLKRLRSEIGLSQRKLAEKAGVSYGHYCEMENERLKDGPTLGTLNTILKKMGYDKHRFAHYAFGLDEPEIMGEINGKLKELCDLALQLDEDQLERVIGYIEGKLEEGGDAATKPGDIKAGHG